MASYRTVEFNRMVMQRPMWMRHLLSRGYSVRYGEIWGDVRRYDRDMRGWEPAVPRL